MHFNICYIIIHKFYRPFFHITLDLRCKFEFKSYQI